MTDTPTEFSPDLAVAQDTLQPFDVREREGLNPMIKLAMVALGLLILAFIVMKLYTPGVRDRSDPPRITADNTPFKVKPEDVGGTQTPNQDKVVFEVMDEIVEAFQAKAFHAGMDEVFYIGHEDCTRCQGRDKAELFAGELTKIRNHLALKDRRLWNAS